MIEVSQSGQVVTITLAAPERRNALRIADMQALGDALNQADNDPNVRVCILTGQGKVFSAGADFGELTAGERPDIPLAELSARIEAMRLPVVAGLNGAVMGAAVDIAAACDLRVAVTGARLAIPAAMIGVHYPGASIARIERSFGPAVAKRLLLAAETFTLPDPALGGWVTACTDAESFGQTVRELGCKVASLAPLSVSGMKRSVNDRDDAAARVTACAESADHAEALSARKEKRTAQFQGQ
ncbi:enoyl-CoA hydratase/isomerase family protein [Pontivivens insulae]|uniref:Putative enoyl-CoA hydratase echA6 n=1 Tax=Pontivivens insulae TaxID=1639689 RepID=A0A2R8AEI6_9RHOB|nr:enoyl-CoA hydratase/isomerase family protein [Pontivivens insulae]RED11917.1 3-hydroxypropionyl-coenzyme A dehydratase [Pontivivens insulae]SPF30673.1 putative enoyl-CoA hydratase echA6 [Pontivivens insulae]